MLFPTDLLLPVGVEDLDLLVPQLDYPRHQIGDLVIQAPEPFAGGFRFDADAEQDRQRAGRVVAWACPQG